MNENLDPFQILGVAQDASEADIRARYLELVKEFPPERNPDKFQQVQAAYAAAKDPLQIARRLAEPPDPDDPPEWSDVIDEHAKRPPGLNVDFLLSLGNRSERYVSKSDQQPSGSAESAAEATVDNPSRQAPHE